MIHLTLTATDVACALVLFVMLAASLLADVVVRAAAESRCRKSDCPGCLRAARRAWGKL